jgi:dTDP-4-amino-4,6-dideoxygalactose transaminase
MCQDKMITSAGEGGVLCLNNEAAWKRAWSYKDIGRDYDAVFTEKHPPGFRWLTRQWGTNWRMTEVQAAVARLQLGELPDWILLRARNASILKKALAPFSDIINVLSTPQMTTNCFYRLYALVHDATVRQALLDIPGGVFQSGSCSEIYREACFEKHRPPASLPGAQKWAKQSLVFRVHPTCSRQQMEKEGEIIVRRIEEVLNKCA